MGITIMKPEILKEVPSYVPQNRGKNYVYQTPDILKTLVKPQVQKMLREGKSNFVVDIERYGFFTKNHPESKAKADVRVFVCSPAEWEK